MSFFRGARCAAAGDRRAARARATGDASHGRRRAPGANEERGADEPLKRTPRTRFPGAATTPKRQGLLWQRAVTRNVSYSQRPAAQAVQQPPVLRP